MIKLISNEIKSPGTEIIQKSKNQAGDSLSDFDHHDHEDVPKNKRFLFEPPLYIQRYDYLLEILNKFKCKSLVDIGCAECKMIRLLKNCNQNLNLIVGLDIDEKLLTNSKELFANNLFDFVQCRENPLDLYLIKGDISDPDDYFLNKLKYHNSGLDCISLIEVIEHLYPDVLDNCIETVFSKLKPRLVLITTPNREYNVVFNDNEEVNDQKFRHWDHKFEWTRNEFETWCENRILKKYKNYKLCENSYFGVGVAPVGFENVGFCSQIALFINQDYEAENSTISENEFRIYLKEKKRIHLLNKESFKNNNEKIVQQLYLQSELFDQKDKNFKLILGLSYPFEIYDFENIDDRNKALFDELNYLIFFLSRPSKSFLPHGFHLDDYRIKEEDQEKLDNNIDLYDERIRLAKIDKLIDFESVKKFNLNKEELVEIMKQNDYKFTKSEKFVIYQLKEESDSEIDDETEKEIYDYVEISREEEPKELYDNFPIENYQIESDCKEIFKTKSNENLLKNIFEEENWDLYIQKSIPVLVNPLLSKQECSLEEQFQDAESNEEKNLQNIEKVLNFKLKTRSDRLKLSDFAGVNYNSSKQREISNKLRYTFKKSLKELKEQIKANDNFLANKIEQFSLDI